jgi:hypothetical protein
MLKKLSPFIVVSVFALIVISCMSVPDGAQDMTMAGVIVTRADGLGGKIDIYIDGRKSAVLVQGGKWGLALQNGRHSISVVYENQRSRVMEFYISNNRQNYSVYAFQNTAPGLKPF